MRNVHRWTGCPIRISTDQFVLADPRGFSQLITSFFASESLGIPRAPLFTYFYFSYTLVYNCYSFYFNMSMNFYSAIGIYVKCVRPLSEASVSRKEVFQPHLPVRLPCYDLAPVTGSTLNGSSRLPSSGLPDFHGLTGGVYKVRERIHRAMADARLLAIPASWGRVADPNPN